MADLPSIANMLTALGTLLTGVAAIAASIAAWVGLTTWKRQETWKHEYDLALGIYRAFRQRRNIYHHIRSPNSIPPVLNNEKIQTEIFIHQKEYDRTKIQLLYWQALKETEIHQADLFDEARLRWNIDFVKLSDVMIDLEHELACALDDLRAASEERFSPDAEAQDEIDQVTSSRRDTENRRQKYDRCFEDIEKALKPKIVNRGRAGVVA